jgi:hypothetical protein
MRSKPLTAACLALAGPVLASALAGCGQHASATAAHPAATAPASQASASRTLTPGQSPAPSADPASSSPPPASPGHPGSPLADGIYADAPGNVSHYTLALAHSGPDTIHGSVTFLYQDGRVRTLGKYTGTLFKDGRLAVLLSNGQRLTGTYQAGHLTLADCSAVLTMATNPGDCLFAYGNTP